jgi:hypothetical protein
LPMRKVNTIVNCSIDRQFGDVSEGFAVELESHGFDLSLRVV